MRMGRSLSYTEHEKVPPGLEALQAAEILPLQIQKWEDF